MSDDDTLRDSPRGPDAPETPRAGRALPIVLSIFGALTALGSVSQVAASFHALQTGDYEGAATLARPSSMSQMPPEQAKQVTAAVAHLAHQWMPLALAAQIPYLVGVGLLTLLSILALARPRPPPRAAILGAAIVAAIARVALGIIESNEVEDAVTTIKAAMPQVGKAAAMATDIGTTMVTLTAVVVALFWLIGGFVLSARGREADE